LNAWGLSLRASAPDDRSLALVLALGALSGAVLLPFASLVAPFVPGCLFHALTGIPCPGCGTTRAVLALAHADVGAALAWNPLATTAIVLGGAACVLAPMWIALRGPVPVVAPSLPRRARWLLALALAANWAWLVATGV